MSRSWDLRYCQECGRLRVHLLINPTVGWRCIGKLKGATSPHGPKVSK